MKILIAEDEQVSRRKLELTLLQWGYEVILTGDGESAWQVLQGPNAPRLAILDWMMPGMDGVDVCRRARQDPHLASTFLILLTSLEGKEHVVAGLESGADDYLTKPFDQTELRARLQTGRRILELQERLQERVHQLEDALSRVKQLQGLLPICSYCKKIRDDQNYWQQVETYIASHSEAGFSHGICPDCFNTVVKSQLEELYASKGKPSPLQ